jgi:thiamine-phosphate pyrophosphorylase
MNPALRKARLYCITTSPKDGKSLLGTAESALKGGADILQLRDKDLSGRELLALAVQLRELCRKYGALFIVNDRLDVALAAKADGAHLGQEDLPVKEAKRLVPENFIIGCSTHSLEQAKKAEEDGADYIGCGPIFKTPTKPDAGSVGMGLVRQYREHIKIPFVAIGGIDLSNVKDIVNAGAPCVAVVRALFGAEDVEASAREFKKSLNQ